MKEKSKMRHKTTEPLSRLAFILTIIMIIGLFSNTAVNASQLKAGVAKVNITNTESIINPTYDKDRIQFMGTGVLHPDLINDSLYVKALVLDNGTTKVVIITVDAIAIGEIGSISNEYLIKVRSQIQKDLNIKSTNVMINASHCHGAGYWVCPDVDQRTIRAVKEAWKNMVPVNIGVGAGYEDRIMENRRLKLKNGKEWDIRHAYPLPPDEDVVGIGPVDPEIGILRLDRKNGNTLAVVYNFACHPYQGVASRGITADFPGFASKVIEDNLSNGAMALFLQGCGGDITTVLYKDVNNPRDAEPLGNMLGLSTVQALRKIQVRRNDNLNVVDEIIKLPRRTDLIQRIDTLEAEEGKLLQSMRGTSLNIKTFIPLYIKYNLSPDYPSYYSHRYLHDKMIGRSNDLEGLDTENRYNIDKYLQNIYAMEKMAKIQENKSLLNDHLAQNEASGEKTIDVEIQGIRIGNFVLVTFPAEVSVQIGLNIKKISPYKFTFVAGVTNGYIYYAPTAEQFKGECQEDCDCLLAPEWQKLFEEKVLEILTRL